MKASGLHKKQAFTLVEVMIVVVILGMLAALAIPGFQKVRLNAQASTIINDIRVHVAAFRQFYLEEGYLPPAQPSYALPAELIGWVEPSSWENGTAVDGARWQYWYPYRGEPTVTLFNDNGWSIEMIELIEKKLDDSNLHGGMIQRSGKYIDYFWNNVPE